MKKIFLCFLIMVLFCGCCTEHEWGTAPCTERRVCLACGKEEETPRGHVWVERTCTEPMTCSDCGETMGKEKGHTIEEWNITLEPTCYEYEKKDGLCSVCGQTVSENIEKIPHTPGEWVISKEATVSEEGIRAQYCTVCNKIVETEKYELSAEEMAEAYKDMQEMTVVNIKVNGVGFANSNDIYVTVKNESNKVVKSYVVGLLCFDSYGYPVIPQYKDSNLIYAQGTVNIQPGNTAGSNSYWILFSQTKLYIKACVKSVEYHDGTTWENPYFYWWCVTEQDMY